jgi:hypothetical protein
MGGSGGGGVGPANVISAVADLAGSEDIVAVTAMTCPLVTVLGGVYSPLGEMFPTIGLIDQLTLDDPP